MGSRAAWIAGPITHPIHLLMLPKASHMHTVQEAANRQRFDVRE